MCFSVNFAKILKTAIVQNTSVTEALSQGVSKKSFSEYYESFP